ALVNGLEVEKTKNGNYNSSYPVKNLETNISYLTNENTHYHVKRESIEGSDLKIIFEGLNDQSVQGLMNYDKNIMSVQFNPEGSHGTNEASFVYDECLEVIKENRSWSDGYARGERGKKDISIRFRYNCYWRSSRI